MGFVKGMEVAETFFVECIRPHIDRHLPDLKYSAALIGSGSEVLGFDTEMSSDHDWGQRVMILVDEDDPHDVASTLKAVLGENQWVQVYTIRDYLIGYLGYDIAHPLTPVDWLTLPQQKLRTLIAGRIFHDDLGLSSVLSRFDYYPHDLWLYMLACAWTRIEQEEHLTGRAGFVGDELGSSIIASRLVRDIMRLCFLMEKQYAPYAKWFGSAFMQLSCAPGLQPHLLSVVHGTDWETRQAHLATSYGVIAKMHNALGITEPLSCEPMQFYTRPFTVISMGRFSAAILNAIHDPQVKRIAESRPIGNIDLFSDSTDMLEDAGRRKAVAGLYLTVEGHAMRAR
jgi:hypothetical protein